MEKVRTAIDMKAEAIMDLSNYGKTRAFREQLVKMSPAMIGSVPMYDAVGYLEKELKEISEEEFIRVIRQHALDGVDFVTVHCGLVKRIADKIKNNARLTEMTVQGMHIYFLSFLFSCINIFVCAYTAAVDRPKYGFFISLCRGILVIVPCAFLLSALLGMTGVWLSIVVCEAIVLLFSLYALKKAV